MGCPAAARLHRFSSVDGQDSSAAAPSTSQSPKVSLRAAIARSTKVAAVGEPVACPSAAGAHPCSLTPAVPSKCRPTNHAAKTLQSPPSIWRRSAALGYWSPKRARTFIRDSASPRLRIPGGTRANGDLADPPQNRRFRCHGRPARKTARCAGEIGVRPTSRRRPATLAEQSFRVDARCVYRARSPRKSPRGTLTLCPRSNSSRWPHQSKPMRNANSARTASETSTVSNLGSSELRYDERICRATWMDRVEVRSNFVASFILEMDRVRNYRTHAPTAGPAHAPRSGPDRLHLSLPDP